MLTTMDGSSTCTSAFTPAPGSCSSPDHNTTTFHSEQQPSSPFRQDSSCAKHPSSKMKHSTRHMPYPDGTVRSPGSCSSDGGESVQSDGDSQDPSTRGYPKVKRVAANSRERKRMHTVNSAFDQLRELVPTYPSNRKLSKIDTLRLACTYIQDLVSLLHNSQSIQGEDVLYHQPFPDTFNGYPSSVKQEMAEFPFEHFRMQPACLRFSTDGCPESSYPSSASESDSTTHSPPHAHHQFMQHQVPQPLPPVSVNTARPPPLTRVSSEGTVSIHTRMAEASISCSGGMSLNGQQAPPMSTATTMPLILPPPPPAVSPPTTPMYQRQVSINITSPLAMHAVHHSSTTPNLLQSGLGQHSPPPVWQRAATVPSGYACALYGQ